MPYRFIDASSRVKRPHLERGQSQGQQARQFTDGGRHRAAPMLGEILARRTHGLEAGGLFKDQFADPIQRLRQVCHTPRGTGGFGQLRGLGEIEGVRPHDDGTCTSRRLDQILPAQRLEAAPQQGQIGQAVVCLLYTSPSPRD